MTKYKSKKQVNKTVSLPMRITLMIIGMTGLIFLFVYSINLEIINANVNIFGYNITTYFYAGLVIITGLIFSSLLKSGFLGRWKMD